MNKFTKYRSIENHYSEEFLDKIHRDEMTGGSWFVSEKIHGENRSIWYDGENFRVARRNGFVEDDENFNSFHRILEEHKKKIMLVFSLLGAKEVVVFGELCGGNYKHPDVKPDNHSKQVNKGVYYSPENLFYVFDIMVDGKYINVDVLNNICHTVGMLYSRFLFKGTMEECLEFDSEFNSKIPGWLGLPELEEDNICEGVVIRPNDDRYLDYGEEDVRVIIKKKNDKFKEKEKQKKEKVKIEFTEEENSWMNIMLEYVNENRLSNVISKIGEVEPKDFGMVMGLFKGDIMTDFCKENPDYGSLDKPIKKKIEKAIGGNLAEVVRKVLIYK